MSTERLLEVTDVLRGVRFRFASEEDLQEGIEAALAAAGIEAEREVILSARDRPDLMVWTEERIEDPLPLSGPPRPAGPGALQRTGIAIEVKVAGSAFAVMQQVERYVLLESVAAILLVTTRSSHWLPPEMKGKSTMVLNVAPFSL